MSTTALLVAPVEATNDWVALTELPLSLGLFADWAVLARCGAIVAFSGTVRDHADGRPGVSLLEYEAYEEQVVPKLQAIVDEARRLWPTLGRMALVHRIGPMSVEESSVIVAVSSPHRPEAFAAARFGIDTLKSTVPSGRRSTGARARRGARMPCRWSGSPRTVSRSGHEHCGAGGADRPAPCRGPVMSTAVPVERIAPHRVGASS